MTSIYRTTHAVQIRTGRVTLTLDIPQAHELLAQLVRALDKTNILPSVAILWEDFNADTQDNHQVAEPVEPDDALIGAAEAQTIARNMYKLRIPKSTLISAYPTIDGAQKVGGRWKMPPGNFREWLDTWASKQ